MTGCRAVWGETEAAEGEAPPPTPASTGHTPSAWMVHTPFQRGSGALRCIHFTVVNSLVPVLLLPLGVPPTPAPGATCIFSKFCERQNRRA